MLIRFLATSFAIAIVLAGAVTDSAPGFAQSSVKAPPLPTGMIKAGKTDREAMNPEDKAELVYVPAGTFRMGTNDTTYMGEQPSRTIYLNGYWIYKYPVTVAQYRKYCEATGKEMPSPSPVWGWQDDHPMVKVTFDDAMAYGKWAGVTLPTEAQWEKAARGTDGREFAWGNKFDATRLWCSLESKRRTSTAPVHRKTSVSESPYGCVDMGGNVYQWCRDWYGKDYYKVSPKRNPTGPDAGDKRVLRGGAWDHASPLVFTTTVRNWQEPSYGHYANGFRCVAVTP